MKKHKWFEMVRNFSDFSFERQNNHKILNNKSRCKKAKKIY